MYIVTQRNNDANSVLSRTKYAPSPVYQQGISFHLLYYSHWANWTTRTFPNYSLLKQDFRLIVPQLQKFNAILLLEKTKLADVDEKTCEAIFCLPNELLSRHFNSPGPRTRRINATHWLNLFDTTGRRRVDPDRKDSDDNPRTSCPFEKLEDNS